METVRELGNAEDFADLRRGAIPQVHTTRVVYKDRARIRPLPLDQFRHRKAALSVVDRGPEKIPPWKPAEALVQFFPTIHATGNRDGMDSRDAIGAGTKHVERERLGAPSAGIHARELAASRIADQREKVSARSTHHRLYDAAHSVRGDCCVHG